MASSTFSTLSNHLQKRIDNAYLNVYKSLSGCAEPPLKKRQVDSEEYSFGGGGGFIIEEAESEDEVNFSSLPCIPISLVPNGLHLLDLPPDDEHILCVFRQAAAGWDEPSSSDTQQLVSLEDWRAVCGVLLEHHSEEYAESSDADRRDVPDDMDVSDAGSDFAMEHDGSDDNASDDNYVEESVPRQRRTRTQAKHSDSDDERDESGSGEAKLTARQKAACLEAFALFFPDATTDMLPARKIMISDIHRVANLLKERIKAEEIVQMLEIFSSSPDKSMNLEDFEQMMVAAKLI